MNDLVANEVVTERAAICSRIRAYFSNQVSVHRRLVRHRGCCGGYERVLYARHHVEIAAELTSQEFNRIRVAQSIIVFSRASDIKRVVEAVVTSSAA